MERGFPWICWQFFEAVMTEVAPMNMIYMIVCKFTSKSYLSHVDFEIYRQLGHIQYPPGILEKWFPLICMSDFNYCRT
jgi:hypothetical protein